jgi:hypothetical protein
MGLTLGGIKVTRSKPTITVRIVNNAEAIESAELILRRVGGYTDILAYTPSSISDDYVEFTFDELLFVERTGRYTARFMVNGVERTSFQIHYTDEALMSIGNKAYQ